MEVSGQLHAPAALPPRERAPGSHWIGGWLGTRAGLDQMLQFLTLFKDAQFHSREGLSPGIKRPEREVHHLPPPIDEVKNARSYTSTPQYVFIERYLIK
jgi:hypothetical protein